MIRVTDAVLRRLLALFGLAVVLAAVSSSNGDTALSGRVIVPQDDILISNTHGRLAIIDRKGRPIRELWHAALKMSPVQGLALAPDREHAYVSFLTPNGLPRLEEVDLSNGATTSLGHAISPTISPNGKRLAYYTVRAEGGITYCTALAIRTLKSTHVVRIPFRVQPPLGTPSELILNWSPLSDRIVLDSSSSSTRHTPNSRVLRVVSVAKARNVESQPAVASAVQPAPVAPVFLDATTILADVNCCVGIQRLAAVSASGHSSAPFAHLSAPPIEITKWAHAEVMVVTALGQLELVSRTGVELLASGVRAAAG